MTTGLASLHQEMLREMKDDAEQVLAKKNVLDWDSEQVVQECLVDTEEYTISLVQDLGNRLEHLSSTRKPVTMKEVLGLGGKSHHAAFVVMPGRKSVRRLVQLEGVHLSREEWAVERDKYVG